MSDYSLFRNLCQRWAGTDITKKRGQVHLKNNTDILPKRINILERELQRNSVGVEIGTILQQEEMWTRIQKSTKKDMQ